MSTYYRDPPKYKLKEEAAVPLDEPTAPTDYTAQGYNSFLTREIPMPSRLTSKNLNLQDNELNISSINTQIGNATSGQVFRVNTDGLSLGANKFADAPFRVNLAGDMFASSATITGSVTATSGAIGGWTVGATDLSAGSGAAKVGLSSAATAGDDVRIYAGDSTPTIAPFRVTESGAMTASSATVTGALTTGASSVINGIYIDSLAVSKLDAGTISSKSIVLAIAAGTGDVEIRAGIAAGDFANAGAANGFIIGLDDSDGDKAKLYFGTNLDYIKFDGTNVSASGLINIDLAFTAGEALTAGDAVGLYGEITLADETADIDVYTDVENPDAVYDTSNFNVGTRGAPNAGDEGQRPYIYWSGLGALIPTGATVISVQFSFNVAVYSASAGQVLVHVCTSGPCSESTTTWNNKPNIEVASFANFTPTATGIYTCSATPTSTQWGRIRDYGIALVENWAGGPYAHEISSRNQANPPLIEITYKIQNGEIFKVNATTAEYANSFMGIAVANAAAAATVKVRTDGKVSAMTGLTPFVAQYLQDTDGAIGDVAGSVSKIVGRALSTTELQVRYAIS